MHRVSSTLRIPRRKTSSVLIRDFSFGEETEERLTDHLRLQKCEGKAMSGVSCRRVVRWARWEDGLCTVGRQEKAIHTESLHAEACSSPAGMLSGRVSLTAEGGLALGDVMARVHLARLYSPESNTSVGVAVKVFYRCAQSPSPIDCKWGRLS